jgi:hypothetical protein
MKSSRHGGSFLGVLATLIVGGALGAAVCYFVLQRSPTTAAAERTPAPAAGTPASPTVEAEREHEDYISRKLREWNLTPDEVKHELANARDVVREKGRALGEKVKSATADVTIVAKIKAKYTLDDQLSALAVIVDCREGHVKLSGTVASADLIGRAIVLALDTDGVVDVVSSIKVARPPEPA